MDKCLETQNINYQNGEQHLIKNFDYSLSTGEFKAIICSSKNEKTALVNILAGLNHNFNGELFIAGANVKKNDVSRSVALVSTDFGFDEDFNIEENLYLYADYFGLFKSTIEKRVGSLIRSFNVDEIVNKQYSELSDMEKFKILTVRALIPEPKMLIVDEDEKYKNNIAITEFIKKLSEYKSKSAILFITTIVPDSADEVDHVSFLNNGRIICGDAPLALMSEKVGEQIAIYKFKKHDLQYFINKMQDNYNYQVIGDKIRIYFDKSTDIVDSASLLPGEDFEIRKPKLKDVMIKISGPGAEA